MLKILRGIFIIDSEDDFAWFQVFPYFPLIFVLYAIYYDLTFLHYKPDILWVIAKTFFIIFPFICIKTKLFPENYRIFILGINWILYSTYHVYFVSLSYYITFIQVIIAFSIMVKYSKNQYIIFSIICLLASIFAITHAQHEMFYVAQGMSAKQEVLINSICLQGLCYLIYYYVTLPRINLTDSDKTFAQYGKSSSFLMHEIAKPLNRIKQNPDNVIVELERLNEIYLIADSIRNKENQKHIIETVNIDKLIEIILEKYKSFIDLYKITIKIENNNNHNIQSSKKLIEFALDNIIRNAIEASVELSGEKYIYINIGKNIIIIKNSFNVLEFNKSNLFKPMSTSKLGHMGVGLYITKMILENLKHKINILVSSEIFEVQIIL